MDEGDLHPDNLKLGIEEVTVKERIKYRYIEDACELFLFDSIMKISILLNDYARIPHLNDPLPSSTQEK